MKKISPQKENHEQQIDVYKKLFQKIKPVLHESVAKLFTIFKEDIELRNIIFDECKKNGEYYSTDNPISAQPKTANDIRYSIMNYYGNTKECASKILDSTESISNIIECLSSYTAPVCKLSHQYLDECLGEIYEQNLNDF